MLNLIIRKELLGHMLTYRFAVTAALFFVLIIGSVQMMAQTYEGQLANYSETKTRRLQELKESTDFRDLMWRGITSDKRPNPLSVFSIGLEKEMSRSVTVSTFQGTRLGGNKYANPLFFLFPPPDLAYIVNIVVSLLSILFVFDAICGEKEDGTLKLMLANPVPRDRILLGKGIGGFLALTLPFLAAIGIGIVFARLTTSLTLNGVEWMRLLSMIGLSVLYIAVFFALGMLISALTTRTSTSLMISFFVWVLAVLIVPNVTPIVARAVVPAPSAGAIARERDGIQRDVWQSVRRKMRQVSREERQNLWDEARAEIQEKTDKLMDSYTRRIDRQVQAAEFMGRISPSSNYIYAVANLAGTGTDDFRKMGAYIGRFHSEFTESLVQIRADRDRQLEGVTDPSERQEIREAPIDPSDLPQFIVDRPGLRASLQDAMSHVLILAIMGILFFVGSYIWFLRYDVT